MEMRSVLITGAGGFVCSHLAAGLAGLGYGVTALDRQFDALTRQRLASVNLVEAELDAATLAVLPAHDIVIHGAAITAQPEDCGLTTAAHIRANLDLLLDTLDWAERGKIGLFVFLSSTGVFMPEDAETELLETTPATGTSAYALAKLTGETIVAGADAVQTLVARLGYLYGPHEIERSTRPTTSLVRQWLLAAKEGRAIKLHTSGCRREWTYVAEIAPALDQFINAALPSGTLIHLGNTGNVLGDAELAEFIAEKAGGEVIVRPALHPVFKAPMGTIRTELSDFPWSPMHTGIQQTLAAETHS